MSLVGSLRGVPGSPEPCNSNSNSNDIQTLSDPWHPLTSHYERGSCALQHAACRGPAGVKIRCRAHTEQKGVSRWGVGSRARLIVCGQPVGVPPPPVTKRKTSQNGGTCVRSGCHAVLPLALLHPIMPSEAIKTHAPSLPSHVTSTARGSLPSSTYESLIYNESICNIYYICYI